MRSRFVFNVIQLEIKFFKNFLGNKNVTKSINRTFYLKQFSRRLKIFHSYNLDLALFPSGKKPHKPRHKCKGKSRCQLGLPFPSSVLQENSCLKCAFRSGTSPLCISQLEVQFVFCFAFLTAVVYFHSFALCFYPVTLPLILN